MAIDINNGLGPLATGGNKASERSQSENSVDSKSAPQSRDAVAKDSVNISEDAQSLRDLQARLERQESFDETRVNEIRQAISQGQYPIDNERLAEKFIQLESKL